MALVQILGETVIKNDETQVSVSSLADGGDKVVGLYFSAHWCPPCRTFTPQLVKWYNAFKSTANGSKLEIVFVSSDKTEASFKEYFAEMPWLALDYGDDEQLLRQVGKKFKVSGIPCLIFLDASTGDINNADGRKVLANDPTGANFPWK